MSGSIPKRTFDLSPSTAEKAAQRWHKEQHSVTSHGKCWCCCSACKQTNPHNAKARRMAVADIAARLAGSLLNVLPPKKPKLR